MSEISRKTYWALESLKEPGKYWQSDWGEYCAEAHEGNLYSSRQDAEGQAEIRCDVPSIACRVVEVEVIVRSLEGEDRLNTWQPIETAPKDGTAVLLYCPADAEAISTGMVEGLPPIVVGKWYTDTWPGWYCGLRDEGGPWDDPSPPELVDLTATHWMPLPSPP